MQNVQVAELYKIVTKNFFEHFLMLSQRRTAGYFLNVITKNIHI
jgi:hypothetical protein